jgi:methylenetetrahydrofolate dehydrogenase (NADP+)/methenyltetrahydrofolate cyclohydrolase
MSLIIDGKRIADEIREEVRTEVAALKTSKGLVPGLAVILVGDDPASDVYVRMKGKACDELGIHSVTDRLPATTSEAELLRRVTELNADPTIHGILVQMPLPKHINESRIIEAIDPRKDVDGFHPVNVGKLLIGEETLRPCTPAGVQELLIRSNIDPAGKHVVVVGRSNIVGKPVASILMQKQKGANAIVTIAHTGAKDLRPYLASADIVIAAIGRPESIRGEELRTGVVVIDVGITRVDDPNSKKGYRLVGDVHFESASAVASAITPVPGGVGPMTIAMLMKNTVKAFRWMML